MPKQIGRSIKQVDLRAASRKHAIKLASSTLKAADYRTIALEPKQPDAIYATPEYRAWRETVIARAGRRCEDVGSDGKRCTKAEPDHRMFADHIVEMRDGGSPFDITNGKCLCGSHHTVKTQAERAKRMASR